MSVILAFKSLSEGSGPLDARLDAAEGQAESALYRLISITCDKIDGSLWSKIRFTQHETQSYDPHGSPEQHGPGLSTLQLLLLQPSGAHAGSTAVNKSSRQLHTGQVFLQKAAASFQKASDAAWSLERLIESP